jgi:hypothetical protein
MDARLEHRSGSEEEVLAAAVVAGTFRLPMADMPRGLLPRTDCCAGQREVPAARGIRLGGKFHGLFDQLTSDVVRDQALPESDQRALSEQDALGTLTVEHEKGPSPGRIPIRPSSRL